MFVLRLALLMVLFILLTKVSKAETIVEFKGNTVVVEVNGVVTEVEIDKKMLTEGDSDAIVDYVLKKLKDDKW